MAARALLDGDQRRPRRRPGRARVARCLWGRAGPARRSAGRHRLAAGDGRRCHRRRRHPQRRPRRGPGRRPGPRGGGATGGRRGIVVGHAPGRTRGHADARGAGRGAGRLIGPTRSGARPPRCSAAEHRGSCRGGRPPRPTMPPCPDGAPPRRSLAGRRGTAPSPRPRPRRGRRPRPSPPAARSCAGARVTGSIRWWTGRPSGATQRRTRTDDVAMAPLRTATTAIGASSPSPATGSSIPTCQGSPAPAATTSPPASSRIPEPGARPASARRAAQRSARPLPMPPVSRARSGTRMGRGRSSGTRGVAASRCRRGPDGRPALADRLQHLQHRGVEPALRHATRPMHRRHRFAQPPRDGCHPTRPGLAVERGQLAVVAEPGQGEIDRRELRLHHPPGVGPRRGERVRPAGGPDEAAQLRPEGPADERRPVPGITLDGEPAARDRLVHGLSRLTPAWSSRASARSTDPPIRSRRGRTPPAG